MEMEIDNTTNKRLDDLEEKIAEMETKIRIYETILKKKRENELLSELINAENIIKEKSQKDDDLLDAYRYIEPIIKKHKKERWGIQE